VFKSATSIVLGGMIIKNLSLESLYVQSVLREAHKIVADELLPSGRRYGFPMCRYNRFKKYFIPFSIKLWNDEWVFIYLYLWV